MAVEYSDKKYKSPEEFLELLKKVRFAEQGPPIADVEEVELDLGDGEKLKGLKFGTEESDKNKKPFYMMAPGSFYYREFPASLKENFIFYSFDADPEIPWVLGRDEQPNLDVIKKVDWPKISERGQKIVEALYKLHKRKVVIGGASAPGGTYPYKLAIEVKEGIVDSVIGIVPAFKPTDSLFAAAQEYFDKVAKDARKARVHMAELKENEILQGIPDEIKSKPPFAFQFFAAKKAGRLLGSNLDQMLKSVQRLVDFWGFNPVGQVVNLPMQQHFFDKIFQYENVQKIYMQFDKMNIKGKIIIADKDTLTPPYLEEISKIESSCANIQIISIPRAGHFVWTHKEDVAEELSNFNCN